MEFSIITIFLLALAAILVLVGIKFLLAPDWFLEFLRGALGFTCIAIALFLLASGLNLASYTVISNDDVLANITFTKLQEQKFEATIVYVKSGEQEKIEVDGDLWQVAARNLNVLGTSYRRLDAISGRFYSLEQQRDIQHSRQALAAADVGFDLWSSFSNSNIGIIAAKVDNAVFSPMANGATFAVKVTDRGIAVKPVNSAAISIVNEWQ